MEGFLVEYECCVYPFCFSFLSNCYFFGMVWGGRETYLGFVGGGKCLWLLVVGVVELFADS